MRILISGGARGIGAACVKKFAADGHNVAFIYRSAHEAAQRLADECGAVAICADISRPNEAREAVAKAIEALGGIDVLVNNDSPSADRGLVNESLNKEIERALSTLATREREIIKSFFGIGCQEMTLEEIGERFGLTRERVRQIKEKAIRKLKNNSRSKLLKSYLG